MIQNTSIVILDFGSQYTQLIARKLREGHIYCEIVPYFTSLDDIKALNPEGIILSGGPASVYEEDAFFIDKEIFSINIPILGICYGMQLITHILGGEVQRANSHEYGNAKLEILKNNILLKDIPNNSIVWMSHSDKVTKVPQGFDTLASSENSPFAIIGNDEKKIYAMQFHPEVAHSQYGADILKNFAINICNIEPSWSMEKFLKSQLDIVKNKVGDKKVLCALSGGVDSSVVTALLYEAIGDNLIPVFVDNGLLREGEREKIEYTFKNLLKVPLITVDARELFLKKLKDIIDPEQKRKIIGHTFIDIFDKEAKKYDDIEFLAQGTLYPDVIESISVKGPSKVIKSHHNVGGLPDDMKLSLIEPLRELFKDEVRILGLELNLPKDVVYRQPFPGPGLAIRIMGEVNHLSLDILKKADLILLEEIKAFGLYDKIWQSFAVLLNVNSVGVMGDNRTYENAICLRIVESSDGMTANFARIDYDILENISKRIINEVDGINRVVYDISSKPPATIEWE
jgi:GMP synthase (glutamine-hydrolysing)